MENDGEKTQAGDKPACPGCGKAAEVYEDGKHVHFYCRTCEPNSPVTLKARVAELETQVENAIDLLLNHNEGQLSRDDVLELIASPERD
jgi:hypothetical protein